MDRAVEVTNTAKGTRETALFQSDTDSGLLAHRGK